MKQGSYLKAAGMTLAALFFALLELLYQVCRFLIKWFLVAIVASIAAVVFVGMLPFTICKCGLRTVRHRSFAAGGQLLKWICIDYFKHLKL